MPLRSQTLRIDFVVINGIGTAVFTADHRDIAIAWAKANADALGELTVEEVELTETRRRVWRPKVQAAQAQQSEAA